MWGSRDLDLVGPEGRFDAKGLSGFCESSVTIIKREQVVFYR